MITKNKKSEEAVKNKNYCLKCDTKIESNKQVCEDCASIDKQVDCNENHESDFVTDLKKYVGKNNDYYLEKWRLSSGGITTKSISINWAGFFLTFFWAGYRKMYGIVLIVFGLFILLDVFAHIVDAPLYGYIGVLMSVFFGLIGNRMYYDKAKRDIAKRTVDFSHGSKDNFWNSGGTSKWGVLLVIGLSIMYLVINVFIIEPIFAEPPKVEFGNNSIDGEIIGITNSFEPLQEMHYAFNFADDKGGKYEVSIKKDEGDMFFIVDEWKDEVPLDCPGVSSEMNAPELEGFYIFTVKKYDEVSAEGFFRVEKQ